MIPFIATALLAGVSPHATPMPRCDVAHLSDCRTINVLLESHSMTRAMERFFGAHAGDRVDYLYANGRLISQVWTVLGGPPDDRRDLPGGETLFTACRPHSCTEKGAVAFDPNGRITAVGIVNFHCGPRPAGCSRGATLDLYLRDDRASAHAGQAAIRRWATAVVAADAAADDHHPLQGVVVHDLRRP